ncbi:DUF1553 domain-containing protein [Alienimonas sp. DA493]|uniref:DUF1553 domain-containing protein n=1 Tax=Alienimonas sp. DA493 TaxID=3373605 RepID=UPI003754BBAF
MADRLADGHHPLTARVATNHLWQTSWGRGLVDAPGNFGVQRPEPRHAALLDWRPTTSAAGGLWRPRSA